MDLDKLSLSELQDARKALLALQAREFSLDGFKAAFELMFDMPLAKHMESAIQALFDADKDEELIGVVSEMFRGASKTTTITIGWTCFLIGHFPDKAFLLVQVGDDIASDNSSQIANIIETNPGFKAAFPHVVPDFDLGWGAKGYEVKCTHRYTQEDNFLMLTEDEWDYANWRQHNAKRKDPTLFAAGYKSRAMIGKRPFALIVDDINDENNTSSERELRKVKKILTGTIFPAANMARFVMFVGTPWTESDALHYCLATGLFKHVRIPIYTDGEPTWPEQFPEKRIEQERKKAGEIEFARMFLLDLSKTKGLVLKKEWIHYWPAREINQDWIRFIGIDFTSTEDPRKQSGDDFALLIGAIIPGGKGLIIEGGTAERLSQAECEDKVVEWAYLYPTLQAIGVESIITGQMFYNNLLNNAELRKSGVPIIPVRFNKSKGHRFEKEMAPMFQRARVYLSDAENPVLNKFVDQWMNWQGDALEAQYHNDTLDAGYALLQAAADFVSPVASASGRTTNPLYRTNKSTSGAAGWSR